MALLRYFLVFSLLLMSVGREKRKEKDIDSAAPPTVGSKRESDGVHREMDLDSADLVALGWTGQAASDQVRQLSQQTAPCDIGSWFMEFC